MTRNNTRHYRLLQSVLAERQLTRIKIRQDARLKLGEVKRRMAEPQSLKHRFGKKAYVSRNLHNSVAFTVSNSENSCTQAVPGQVRKPSGSREELCASSPLPPAQLLSLPCECPCVCINGWMFSPKLNRWCSQDAWKSTARQNLYSNRHVSKSFNNNGIFSLVLVVSGRGSCNKNNIMNISFLVYSNMQKALKLLKTEL